MYSDTYSWNFNFVVVLLSMKSKKIGIPRITRNSQYKYKNMHDAIPYKYVIQLLVNTTNYIIIYG